MRRFGCALVLALGVLGAHAHDLIDAQATERYLNGAQQNLDVIGSRAAALKRAEANLALGVMLDEIRDLLNRDIATHGKVQGLPSNLLVSELKAKGAQLMFFEPRGRFLAPIGYYRTAFELSPDGATASAALVGWMRGHFYDSFADDPLDPRYQTAAQLREQIALGERFVSRYPAHADIEEVQFILLAHYVQAALSAGSADRGKFEARARDAGRILQTRYPDSMRTAAVPVFLEKLSASR